MKRFFTENMKLKILAILLAILAWVYVHSSQYTNLWEPNLGLKQRTMTMPVEYENLRAGLEILRNTDRVELTVQEKVRTFIMDQPFRAYVDLSEVQNPGRYFLEIQIDVPVWIKVIKQDPRYSLIIVEEVK